MNIKGLLGIVVVSASVLLGSCQKADQPVRLPEKGEAEYGIVEMGEDYEYQLFFDFETASIVKVSEINSWDLAFDASVDGYNVFMNGGADVKIYNTHETDISKVTTAPDEFGTDWEFDSPTLVKDSTAIGDWREGKKGLSKNEVYIVRQNPTGRTKHLKKMVIVSVTATEYVIQYADLDDTYAKTVTIPKDDTYSYAYFSFDEGGHEVFPDPPKNSWDIVFTRYRYIYYYLDNFPYVVSGALINPHNTMGAAVDSSVAYKDVTGDMVFDLKYTDHRDVIGFSWKEYDMDKAVYTVNPNKTYIIKNRKDEYWKLHFLDFYNQQGVKGSPSFEFERMY